MDEDRKYCVYKHTSPSGKVYIGITRKNPHERWRNGRGYIGQSYFWNAIQKYGWENFIHEILHKDLTKEEAEEIEIDLIAYYKSDQRSYGYNIERGGFSPGERSEETKMKISKANRGKVLSEETKEKISQARKECWKNEDYRKNVTNKLKKYSGKHAIWYGRRHSEETKQKIREAHAGIVVTDETRKKLSFINSGEGNPFYGKKHSVKSIEKMSIAHKGDKNGFAKMVLQLDKSGTPIKIWNCIQQASKILDVNANSISLCCRGEQKTSGGYRWLYIYDQTKRNGVIVQGAISLGYLTEEDVLHMKEQL